MLPCFEVLFLIPRRLIMYEHFMCLYVYYVILLCSIVENRSTTYSKNSFLKLFETQKASKLLDFLLDAKTHKNSKSCIFVIINLVEAN